MPSFHCRADRPRRIAARDGLGEEGHCSLSNGEPGAGADSFWVAECWIELTTANCVPRTRSNSFGVAKIREKLVTLHSKPRTRPDSLRVTKIRIDSVSSYRKPRSGTYALRVTERRVKSWHNLSLSPVEFARSITVAAVLEDERHGLPLIFETFHIR